MDGMNICKLITLLCFSLLTCSSVQAQTAGTTESLDHADNQKNEGNINWKLATLGGTQFWTDVRVVGGWRIQRNSYFGHFRLLDNEEVRQAWGKENACVKELEKNLKAGVIQPYSGKVVILLHGLCRSWRSMQGMEEHLKSQGYTVLNFRYASSRQQVDQHAYYLKRVISELPSEVSEINFVGHSLGNIVVRHYVADCGKSKSPDLDTRINRMVMLGPPNQGSRMARIVKDSVSFKLIAGASGAQLSFGWDELNKNLATPEFEFGIIAGGYGDDDAPWSNILLPGRDDFTVSEWETMLPGADDFLVKPLLHTTMMHQEEVYSATTRFLEKGYFTASDQKKPIDSLPENPRELRESKSAK